MLGIGLIVVGAALVWLPIATTSVSTVALGNGNWTQFHIPSTATLGGESVRIVINWSGYGCYGGVACVSLAPFELTAVDCGSSSCTNLSTIAPQGPTYPGNAAGETAFSGVPGHYYGILLTDVPFLAPAGKILTISYIGPAAGGWAGAGLVGLGIVPIVVWLRQSPPPRPRNAGF